MLDYYSAVSRTQVAEEESDENLHRAQLPKDEDSESEGEVSEDSESEGEVSELVGSA